MPRRARPGRRVIRGQHPEPDHPRRWCEVPTETVSATGSLREATICVLSLRLDQDTKSEQYEGIDVSRGLARRTHEYVKH